MCHCDAATASGCLQFLSLSTAGRDARTASRDAARSSALRSLHAALCATGKAAEPLDGGVCCGELLDDKALNDCWNKTRRRFGSPSCSFAPRRDDWAWSTASPSAPLSDGGFSVTLGAFWAGAAAHVSSRVVKNVALRRVPRHRGWKTGSVVLSTSCIAPIESLTQPR